jgi:two-component system sensor histidine kinase RegB
VVATEHDNLSRNALNLRWLLRLRWGEAAGQTAVILLVALVMQIQLALGALMSLVGLVVVSNALCWSWARGRDQIEEWVLAAVLALDISLLTAMLYLSGGSFNPFNFLYLVHITLGAVVLSARYAWALVAQSTLFFGALFVVELGSDDPSAHMHHADQMQIHLQGMWVAFAVAALFIVYFVHRISTALRQRDVELAHARERSVRSEKLASLATLAAGAAHELSTPLSTIALVAHESEQALADGRVGDVAEDMRLIEQQVGRCRDILDQMSAEAGENPGEALVTVSARELIDAALADVHKPNPLEVSIDDALEGQQLQLAKAAGARALRGLVDNACDASDADAPVQVRATRVTDGCCIEVRDGGAGMSDDVLARAGEPFFTTKDPGRGMGLGLFLTRTIAEHMGGSLTLSSRLGEGTSARLTLPLLAATTRHIAPDAAAEE